MDSEATIDKAISRMRLFSGMFGLSWMLYLGSFILDVRVFWGGFVAVLVAIMLGLLIWSPQSVHPKRETEYRDGEMVEYIPGRALDNVPASARRVNLAVTIFFGLNLVLSVLLFFLHDSFHISWSVLLGQLVRAFVACFLLLSWFAYHTAWSAKLWLMKDQGRRNNGGR
jgi:hypothetical protein